MNEVIAELEALIRSGRFDAVEKRLRRMGKVERRHAVAIANIARRVNCLNYAVKILNPIVRPTDALQSPATAAERIEYADALRQLGAVDEAWELLNEVDTNQFPQAGIHKAFCLFNQWKYEDALPILRSYVQHAQLTPYVRTVGQINLAATLIQVGELEEAEILLQCLRQQTKGAQTSLLYGNSLELSAQLLILQGDFTAALATLNEAADVLKTSGKVVSLYVKKWTAIAKSLIAKSATEELLQIQQQAISAKHWETVRDCDFYRAFLEKDLERMQRLYYGTPFESFRRRIVSSSVPGFQISPYYIWSSGLGGIPPKILNLSSGRIEGTEHQLPLGQSIHRLLILLCRDFYRPLSVLSAFGKLFPDEYMNATTSANRVHQIVKRAREWLCVCEFPLQIEEIDGAYRIHCGDGTAVAIPAKPVVLDAKEIQWALLEEQLKDQNFDVHRANQVLSFSTSNTKILLRWGIAQGRLQKSGNTSRTSYKIISKTAQPNRKPAVAA